MALDESNVINGRFGRVIINGYEMFVVEEASLTWKVDRDVIKGTGLRAAKKVYRRKDDEVTGKFKVKKIDNMGLREYTETLKRGEDPHVLIEMSLVDPEQYGKQEERVSFIAWLEGELKLMDWQNGNFIDQEYSFQADPSSLSWINVIDGDRQDMFTKNM